MACGHMNRLGVKCDGSAGHATLYHARRLAFVTQLWAVEGCRAPYPDHTGWVCSLAKGHQGAHRAYPHHIIVSGEEPKYVWDSALRVPEISYPEMTPWDLLPDATEKEIRDLPTLEDLLKKGEGS